MICQGLHKANAQGIAVPQRALTKPEHRRFEMATDFKPCSVDGCNGNAATRGTARGFCLSHYNRFLNHGDPLGGGTYNGEPMRWINEVVIPYDGDECLIWPFKGNSTGYAQIWIGDTLQLTTRVVCERVHGPAPTPSHECAHSCGKGKSGCVTPSHLRWATRSENHLDKVLHGTHNRGDQHPFNKLSEDDVLAIRTMASNGVFQNVIADQFNVSRSLICKIVARKRWEWLD